MTNQSATATTAHGGESIRFIPVHSTLYPWLVAVFVVTFLISNINATKGVQLGPLITDGAFFLFPISYVIGDVIAEVYGFKAARRAVFTGFGIAVVAVLSFYIAIWLPAADFYDMDETFAAVLGLLPRIVVASLAGYVVGQLLNAWVLQKMKDRFGTGNLWARLIGSTVVGEFADTLLFCSIAAGVIFTIPALVLMGYYNPIHRYGVERFLAEAAEAELPNQRERALRKERTRHMEHLDGHVWRRRLL